MDSGLETLGTIFGVSTAASFVAIKGGLAYLGFSSIGPVAGTTAACMQAGVGNVVAGSAFAVAQSLAMSGIAAIATPVVVTGAIITGAIYLGKVTIG